MLDTLEKQNCSSSEFGCCELNFICDMREYYRNFYNESSYIVTKTYQSNMKHGYISKSMGISKIDEVGSNVPSIMTLLWNMKMVVLIKNLIFICYLYPFY